MSSAVPNHIAIVMDGNGRWATRRYLPRVAGHKAGVDALRRCVRACAARGVSILTVFAFSSENWNRPKEEVSGLMELLVMALSREVPQLVADGVCLRFLGERAGLSAAVRAGLVRAEAATADNTRLILNVCFNYGGRWDIVQATRRAMADGIRAQDLDEDALSKRMAMHFAPDPDLFIRTGGEVRISNFLLWQVAYSELYFTDCLWPDFGPEQIDAAIESYRERERRYGGRLPEEAVAQAATA